MDQHIIDIQRKKYQIGTRSQAIAKFKAKRIEEKLTQTELAEILHITQSDISLFETNRWDKLSTRVLVRLLRLQNYHLLYMACGDTYTRWVITEWSEA